MSADSSVAPLMNQMLPMLKKPHVHKDAVSLIVLREMWQNHVNALLGLIVLKSSNLQAYSRGKLNQNLLSVLSFRLAPEECYFKTPVSLDFTLCHWFSQ
jgi:hypothetical protein